MLVELKIAKEYHAKILGPLLFSTVTLMRFKKLQARRRPTRSWVHIQP
jgi:hypothetical protein